MPHKGFTPLGLEHGDEDWGLQLLGVWGLGLGGGTGIWVRFFWVRFYCMNMIFV